MSALRNVEDTIGGFVERVFGRLFRGHVEPVELARKLAREMEDHKTVSVSRVYVPNEYVVYLSPTDRNRFASFEASLTTELGVYLSERARHEGLTLLSQPMVTLEADTDLRVGEYGIACRVVDPPVETPVEVDAASPDLPDPAPLPLPVAAAPSDADPSDDGVPVAADVPVDEPDPLLESDIEVGPEGVIADELPATGSQPLDPLPVEADATPPPDGEPAATDPPVAEPLPEPVAVPDAHEPPPVAEPPSIEPPRPQPDPVPSPAPSDEPVPVARVSAPQLPVVPDAVPVPPVPTPPVATPLPPPGGYEPLAGVSGTQILSAAEARAEGLVQEEMTILVDGRRLALSKRATTLGRSRDCDIVVQDSNASRLHAEIRHIGLDYFIVDSNSTNGTIVNGQRIRRHALAHGDRIQIGTTELIVEHAT